MCVRWHVCPLCPGDLKHLGSPDKGIYLEAHMHVDTYTPKHSLTLLHPSRDQKYG